MGSTQTISRYTVFIQQSRFGAELLFLSRFFYLWFGFGVWAASSGFLAAAAPAAEATGATGPGVSVSPSARVSSKNATSRENIRAPLGPSIASPGQNGVPDGQLHPQKGLSGRAMAEALGDAGADRAVDSPGISWVGPLPEAARLDAIAPGTQPGEIGAPRRSPQSVLKTEWLAERESQTAQDLLAAPSAIAPLPPTPVDEPQWAIAPMALAPLAPAPPPTAPAKTGPPLPVNLWGQGQLGPMPAIAADPGNPTPPPVLQECPNFDPELGCLRLQDPLFPGAPPPKSPVLYLVPRVDFFRSDNVLLGIDPVDDGLVRPSIGLLALPQLGPRTYIIASVDGAFSRYFQVPEFSYDELRVRAGILQQLSPVMWGEIGWTNQQLFIASDDLPGFPAGTRFLNDHALRLEISRRDQLAKRLSLNSVYQLRVGFAEPEERSRILNVLYLSLNYDLATNMQLGLDYQLAATSYTVVPRTDIYHQLLGRVSWTAVRNVQTSVYGGISFGNSTEPGIDFNSFVLGVSVSLNLAIF